MSFRKVHKSCRRCFCPERYGSRQVVANGPLTCLCSCVFFAGVWSYTWLVAKKKSPDPSTSLKWSLKGLMNIVAIHLRGPLPFPRLFVTHTLLCPKGLGFSFPSFSLALGSRASELGAIARSDLFLVAPIDFYQGLLEKKLEP